MSVYICGDQVKHASGDEEAKLIGKLQDGKDLLKVHGEREGPCEFNIDAEQVLVELDKVVVTMKKGEIALVIIFSENAVGAREVQLKWIMIPPNSTLYYAFELVSVIFVKDQKIEVDGKEHEGSNSHTINIMAGVDDRRTFYSACIGVQVHVEDVTTIASICFDLKDGAKIYKKLIMMAGIAYASEKNFAGVHEVSVVPWNVNLLAACVKSDEEIQLKVGVHALEKEKDKRTKVFTAGQTLVVLTVVGMHHSSSFGFLTDIEKYVEAEKVCVDDEVVNRANTEAQGLTTALLISMLIVGKRCKGTPCGYQNCSFEDLSLLVPAV